MLKFKSELLTGFPVAEITLVAAKVFGFIDTVFAWVKFIDIDSSFLSDSTRNTLYQLIGRAGRKGKSHSATIIFRNDEMLNFIFKSTTKNIEAENIERNYIRILGK